MNLNKYIIIFLMVVLGIFFVDNMRIDDLKSNQFDSIYLVNVFDNALIDAANFAKVANSQHGGFANDKLEPSNVIDALFSSIAFSLDYTSSQDLSILKLYIPFVIITDLDGFYVYKLELDSSKGSDVIKHRIYPKEHFLYHDSNAIYSFDTRFNIRIYDKLDPSAVYDLNVDDERSKEMYKSQYKFLESTDLKKKMKLIMYDQLEAAVEEAINSHNFYTAKKGIFYDFDWEDGLRKSGILNSDRAVAFMVQGLPISEKSDFKYMAFNKIGIGLEDNIYGFEKNGIKYYSDVDPKKFGLEIKEVFTSTGEAAKSGYYKYQLD